MNITVDLEPNEASALLRVLRLVRVLRIDGDVVDDALRGQPETAHEFDSASEKLRIALANALGPRGGPELLRPRYAGILKMQTSGRWAVCRPGHHPVEITSGELFRVEVAGELRLTRMEYSPDRGGYYSIDGYELRDGMRAAIGGGE